MVFAEILRDLIEEKGVSLRGLEAESGVTSSQYSKYLKGLMPSVQVAIKIANFFEVSLDYLFGVEDRNYFGGEIILDAENFVSKYEEILRRARVSHYKLAKRTTMSESSLRRWRKGHLPSMDALVIIAENLSVSIDYLITKVICE